MIPYINKRVARELTNKTSSKSIAKYVGGLSDTDRSYLFSELVKHLGEDECVDLHYAMSSRYKWAGMVFTQNEIIELIEDDDIPETIQNDLVREVVDSWHWNEGMDDALAETGYALLNEVIRDILDI
jgi:hypothetical protein